MQSVIPSRYYHAVRLAMRDCNPSGAALANELRKVSQEMKSQKVSREMKSEKRNRNSEALSRVAAADLYCRRVALADRAHLLRGGG